MLIPALLWLCVKGTMSWSPAPRSDLWTSPCSPLHSLLLDPAPYFIREVVVCKWQNKILMLLLRKPISSGWGLTEASFHRAVGCSTRGSLSEGSVCCVGAAPKSLLNAD